MLSTTDIWTAQNMLSKTDVSKLHLIPSFFRGKRKMKHRGYKMLTLPRDPIEKHILPNLHPTYVHYILSMVCKSFGYMREIGKKDRRTFAIHILSFVLTVEELPNFGLSHIQEEELIVASGNTHLITLTDSTAEYAAKYGRIEVLEFAKTNGYLFDEYVLRNAARSGDLRCLIYLIENGCRNNNLICRDIAFGGNLVCLKYAREKGFQWDNLTCDSAAISGSLEILKYARENGCWWSTMTCKYAVSNGHLGVLRYLMENGCMYGKWTYCHTPIRNNIINCLIYLHENGREPDEHIYQMQMRKCLMQKS